MPDLQQAQADFELCKYQQLFSGDRVSRFERNATLRDSLNDCIDLTIVRLAVYGVFLVLTDSERSQFIIGRHRADANKPYSHACIDSEDRTLLQIEGSDRQIWTSIFQDMLALNPAGSCPEEEMSFNIPDLNLDPRTVKLTSLSQGDPHSYLAGIPLTSKNGHMVGVICVLDRTGRSPLSTAEVGLLSNTAQRCMALLELARERGIHERWTSLQQGIDTFLRSDSLRAEILKGPQLAAIFQSSQQNTITKEEKETKTERQDPDKLSNSSLAGLGDPPIEGGESQRLADAENKRDHSITARENLEVGQTSKHHREHSNEPTGETTYRKVFRKAAECLRSALEVDGVLFVDGLLGFHGDIQPVAEPEQELFREIARPSAHDGESPGCNQAGASENTLDGPSSDLPRANSRIYSSAEYLKGVYVGRPAEVLGLAGSTNDLRLKRVSRSTLGLTELDEGFLQRLMDRHPNGVVWHHSTSGFKQVKDEALVEIDLAEEINRLGSLFKNVKQAIFKPLTDPASRKRLGACIMWRTKSMPLFTDVVDLGSVRTFTQIIESEIARCDASHVAKQKETFVSSVSHELRTPLHGILGAVQLLDESGLTSTQKSLAKVITTSGSTLHETLTSVLSYAKINQFERRQHQYRQRHPPDTVWALSDERGLASGPDRDYEGLYICTNLAMLCEETLGVLEAGKSFNNPHGEEVIVVCNIEYQKNWTYSTEPGAIRRIAVNLIGNALKYTKSGSVIVSLSAARVVKDDQRVSNDLASGRTLTLTVRDTGKGISKSFMDEQLFLPFTQQDSTSSHGVGLGMSIVKSLISLLGGEIEVRSEEQKGTEVNVRIPMRLCSPNEDDKGEAATQFEDDIQTIRQRKLSAVIYGFPDHVRESLITYLCDWYDCTLLEPSEDVKPDIVLVDEGNEQILGSVKRTAAAYGKCGVLLSIVMIPSRLGKRMDMVDGYIKWERVPRPMGPNSVAKALISCLAKLDDLRKYGENASVDKLDNGEAPQAQKDQAHYEERKAVLANEHYMPSLDLLRISEASQSSTPPMETEKLPSDPLESSSQKEQASAVDELRMKPDPSEPIISSLPTPRILIVDDNALNLKLLGAFFRKNGYLDTKQAKDGREAVESVSTSTQGFDIIFMDLSMPVMDGFEATRQIRQMQTSYGRASAAKESVIIALTGLASQEDEDKAFDAGVDLFLTKPVQFPKLSKLLRQYEEGTLRTRWTPE